MFKILMQDARHFQLLILGSLLIYIQTVLNQNQNWEFILIIFSVCTLTQLFAIIFLHLPTNSLKSSFISALGLSLLLKSNSVEVYALASFIAIASKLIFRINNQHFFNPVNIALVLVILLTQEAWISPGQWGSSVVSIFLFSSLGFLVLTQVNRLTVSAWFLLFFGGLHFVKSIIYKGWPIDFWLHQMGSGSLLLFTFFMITDPRSGPNNKLAQKIWASFIGIASFLLSDSLYVHAAPIWVLAFASLSTPLLNKYLPALSFQWNSSELATYKSK